MIVRDFVIKNFFADEEFEQIRTYLSDFISSPPSVETLRECFGEFEINPIFSKFYDFPILQSCYFVYASSENYTFYRLYDPSKSLEENYDFHCIRVLIKDA